YKRRMRSGGRGAYEFHPQSACELLRFDIEIVNDLHVVRNKTNRRDDDVPNALIVKLFQMVANVGTEPRLRRRTTAALVDNLPVLNIQRLRNQPCGFVELSGIVAVRLHRRGNAVRGEGEMN